MNNLFKRLWRHKGQSILTMLILFVLATLLFMSQMMSKANAQLSAMIEEDMKLMNELALEIRKDALESDDFEVQSMFEGFVAGFSKQLWFIHAMKTRHECGCRNH